MDEAATRKKLIDAQLRLAGWDVGNKAQVVEEYDIDLAKAGLVGQVEAREVDSPYAGHRFADYALQHHGKTIAVIEAKRSGKDADLGKEQALQYAQQIQKLEGGDLPFVFFSNGHDTYFWESDFYPPQKIYGFPRQGDLEWLDKRRRSRKPLSTELIQTRIAGRDYQIAAIRSILEGLEKKQSKFLLTMATGTGKTRTAAALIDVLKRAQWAKRILFLVDRIALRDQARDDFAEHIPSEPHWPQKNESEDFPLYRSVYVATYPTMLNLLNARNRPADWISPFFFDVIIADESHRSIYNTYKQVLDYFCAIKIGLTATPTSRVDHDTFALFDRPSLDPTFAYSYEEAVAHEPPYLCDFQVLKVRSKFQIEGIRGEKLPQPEQRQLIAEGKDIDEIDFEGSDLERSVSNAGTNALIVREFMEESIKDQSGSLPGKSIIFAISKAHARRLEALFNAMYPEHKGNLARVIVSEDPRVHGKGGLLDQFKNNDMPRVAISVDMLDTGVDVREIVNLVFAKPVYSYTKFWQMIGRGTRVLDDVAAKRKPWCQSKDKFLIIDCWDNFEFFKLKPQGKEPNAQTPATVRLFRARLDQLEAAIAAGDSDVQAHAIRGLRNDLAALPPNNVVVADHARELQSVSADAFWQRPSAEALGFLRSKIAPVLRARTPGELKSLRFEGDAVAWLTAHAAQDGQQKLALQEALVQQMSELPMTVNTVQKQAQLIALAQQTSWWASADVAAVESLVKNLAPLMGLRRGGGGEGDDQELLNLRDDLAIKEQVIFGPQHERLSSSAYRERVEKHINGLVQQNQVLQKIKAGQQVSDSEIHQLAEILRGQDPYVTEQLLRKVYDHKSARFIQFIRHILGIEPLANWRQTVTQAFDQFIAAHSTFSEKQIQFLQALRTFVLEKGKAERGDLIAAPFTNVHPQGVRGLFQKAEIEEIVGFVEKVSGEAA